MILKPGGTFHGLFICKAATGALADADTTPVAVANHNGSDDGAFTLTVSHLATGIYHVSGTVPVGYAVGDVVYVRAAATVSGVASGGAIGSFQVETLFLSELIADLLDMALAGHTNAGTVGRALQLARAAVGGNRVVASDTETIYDTDGTVIRTFDLLPHGGPYSSRMAGSE